MRCMVALALLTGCSAKAAPPPAPPAAPAPVAAAPAPESATASFGRYTVVPPAGYESEARDIEIGFRRDDILIIALDGAEFKTPERDKCEGQLAAFATGVVTGLAREPVTVTVASSKSLANGCRLTGTTSGTPTALV